MEEPNDDANEFVSSWLAARKEEGRLDRAMLDLVDKHRSGSALDEAGLLKALAKLVEETENTDGPISDD